MKLVIISDTHTLHDQIELPEGDLLIHCGDFCSRGSVRELIQFNQWLMKQAPKFKHGILISPGNHDICIEEDPGMAKAVLSAAKLLIHEQIEIEGIKFWLSPFQPEFHDWSYNVLRGPEIAKKWAQIPEDTRVLVTHGPPYGILDQAYPEANSEFLGCEELLKRVKQLPNLTHHFFGHIHGSFGQNLINNITFANASQLNERYEVTNKPLVFDI